MTDIRSWLEGLGLAKYADAFIENDVEMEVMPELTDADLRSLGVSLGHRKRMLKAIDGLATKSTEEILMGKRDEDRSTSGLSDPERRFLSLMFCDLADSTTLSTTLDIEEVHEINRAFQETCAAAITRFGGFVARYMGDGVLAYFGYPVAHEDDAERAIRAGLEICSEIREIGDNHGFGAAQHLAVRIGIASGPVVVEVIGEGAAQESAVVGEAPNLAARLQNLADPNTVLVDDATRNLIAERFEYDSIGKHVLKGFSAEINIWKVRGEVVADGLSNRSNKSMLPPMIGRDEELGLLLSRWERAKQGEGQVILLSGEAGIGKTRIIQAIGDKLASEDCLKIRYFCSSYHTQSPLHPFVARIERECDFTANDSPEQKLGKLQKVLIEDYGFPTALLRIVGALLSMGDSIEGYEPLQDPVTQLALLQDAIIENVMERSKLRPVFFVLEDVHWIDPTTRNFLDLLVEQAQYHRVLVLFTSRPTKSFDYNHTHVTRLSLNRLSNQQTTDMISILSGNKIEKAIASKIREKSDGIPLFIEEVTKMMVGAKNTDPELQQDLPNRVPDSLQASLLPRLDRLGGVKHIAQTASVLGDTFSLEILVHICEGNANEIESILDLLVDNEILYRQRNPTKPHYRFRHALLRDAAYESLLKKRRINLHAKTARYLAENTINLSGQDDEIIAWHYQQAADSENAYRHWLSAGNRALESGATREAAGLLKNATRFMPSSSDANEDLDSMYQLHIAYGRALNACEGAASRSAHDAFRTAVNLSKKLGETAKQVDALDYVFGITFNAGRLKNSLQSASEMLDIGKQSDDLVATISGYQALGMAYFCLGEFDSAKRNLESALDTRGQEVTGVNAYPSMTMDYLACVLAVTGEPDAAASICEQAYASALEESDYSQATALSNGCMVQVILGDMDVVLEYSGKLIELAEKKGQYMYLNRGQMYHHLAEAIKEKRPELLKFVIDSVMSLLDANEEIETTFILGTIAESLVGFGQFDSAENYLARAIDIANNNNEHFYLAELHRLKAELCAVEERGPDWMEESQRWLQQGDSLAESQGAKLWLDKLRQTRISIEG